MVLQFAGAAPMFAEALPALTAAGGMSASGTGAGLMSQSGGIGSLISSLLGKGGSNTATKKTSEQDQLLKLLGGMNPAGNLAGQSQFSVPGSPNLGGVM